MRRSPIHHTVKGHKRGGKQISSFTRGKGKKSQRSKRVVGRSRPIFRKHDNHAGQLYDLINMGVKKVTLVNIDAHDDLIDYSDQDIERREWSDISKDPDSAGIWLTLAIDRGLVGEVFWVVPDPVFKDFAGDGLSSDFTNVRFRKGRYYAKYKDVNFTITTLDNLPTITKPVVLSIDSDYLGEADQYWSDNMDEGGWINPVILAKKIKKKVPSPRSVSVFRSSAYLSRHIYEEADILEDKIREEYE